jgi:demethylmenaquinone methyltransferase/2-methoxy-6-polyprenyl-1,4-benzoquinol methylase
VERELDEILHEQHRYYEDRAPEYDDVWYRRGIYDLGPDGNRRWFEETAKLESAVDELDMSGLVLELACGTGLFTRHLARRAQHVIAVDAAASALAINRDRVRDPRVRYVHADLFRWEPPAGVRFDAIFFAFLVSHIPPQRFARFWDRLKAWLGPEGYVFFCDDVAGTERRASDPGEPADDGPDFAHRRRLTDGREYTIVKILYGPEQLGSELAALGWESDIRTTGDEFYYGVARPRSDAAERALGGA